MLAHRLTDLIGKTPLLKADRYAQEAGIPDSVELLTKLEYFNPSSSVKDRAAFAIIEAAVQSGALKEGGTLVEGTSGNMGIGLASVATALGYHMVVTMPETMSVERRKLMAQLGVELILTPGDQGMNGANKKAQEIATERGAVLASQFENAANPEAHYKTTGPEIMADVEGSVDYFVAGVGTGGTLMGTGKYLKEQNADTVLVAVEPETSAVLSGNAPGKHGIQGIGAGFVPGIVNVEFFDEVISVSTEEAYEESRRFARAEGALVGISSGAALVAAKRIAERPEAAGKRIVVMLPDTAERYLSTPLFE